MAGIYFDLKIIAVLCAILVGAEGDNLNEESFKIDNGVYVLTEANFDEFLENSRETGALVEFYAPWCGHCKALTPEYEKAAGQLAKKSPPVRLGKVDATVEMNLGKKFDVQGYPTLKFWKGETPIDYDGPRDADGIVQWLTEKTDPNYKPPPEAVVTLTKENFDVAGTAPLALVEFYAPWCGHCKRLAPEFEKAAQRLKYNDPPILLGKVDATVESDLAAQYQVTGYPTLKILRNGRRFEYSGPRDADGIVRFMKEQAVPAAKEYKTVKEAQRKMSVDDVSIIGYFESADDSLFESFKEAAEALREDFSAIGYSFETSVAEHFGAIPGQIVLYFPERHLSPYEEKTKVLDNPAATREDISSYFLANCVPLVGHRTPPNQSQRFRKRPLVVVYFTVDFSVAHRDGTQYWRKKVVEVAKDFQPTFTFAISDEDEFASELKEIGLGDSTLDANVVVFGKDGKRYVMDPDVYDEFTEDNLREFLTKLNQGRVKPFVKSQPVPKDDGGPVKALVASNFNKYVKDESKDVLIEFYAPWCGHCKKLDPVLKELATKLKSEKNLLIAKMDATSNDSPENYNVEGFPTIYFAPSGKKDQPIKYAEANRDVDDFIKFMKQHAVVSFKKTEL